MYNDEELMLFAESYQKMQRKGTAGKKIIGTVSERLNESIDSQIKATKLKKMVKALLECEKMKGAKKFLKSISLTECKAKDLAKVEKLYKLYEEIEDVKEEDEKDLDENNPNEFMDTMRDIAKEVKKGGKIHDALIETICYAIENLDEVSLDPMQADYADSLYQVAINAYEDIKKYAEEAELYNESDDEEEIEEAEDDDADGDPDVAVIKSGFISDYKSDKLSLYKFLQAIVEFGQWIMTHGKNEERNVMKSLLAVLEDEFIPKFAELPGATDDSTVDDEPADDADEEIPADAEDDTEDDTEDVDVEVDDEEPAEDEEEDIDVDAEDEEETTDESDDEEDIELDVEESEDEEEIEEADGDIIEICVPSIYHEPDEAKKLIKQFKKKYNVAAKFYDGDDQYSSWTFSGKRENLKKLFNGYFETTKDDDDDELASCVLDDDDLPLLKKILA